LLRGLEAGRSLICLFRHPKQSLRFRRQPDRSLSILEQKRPPTEAASGIPTRLFIWQS